ERPVHRDAEAEEVVGVVTAEIDAIREEHDRQVLSGIDPHARAREPGVAEGVEAEKGEDPLGPQHQTESPPLVSGAHVLGPRERTRSRKSLANESSPTVASPALSMM